MSCFDHNKILEKFSLITESENDINWITEPLGNGNINGTYRVKSHGGEGEYVLQEINHHVFKDVDGLMNNIICVTSHLKELGVKTLELVSLRDEQSKYHYHHTPNNTFWRVFKYIPKSKVPVNQSLITYQDVVTSAKAFGDFQYHLRHLSPENLKEIIPHFHNTRLRYTSFLSAMNKDSVNRLKNLDVQNDINFVLSREKKYVDVLLGLHDPDMNEEVPIRVVHNDTKISNVLLSEETGDVICVIDLDTVMPGRSLYDFADIVRSTCSSCGEEESDLNKIHMRLDMFRAAAEGYLSSAMYVGDDIDGKLWNIEIEHLHIAGQVLFEHFIIE